MMGLSTITYMCAEMHTRARTRAHPTHTNTETCVSVCCVCARAHVDLCGILILWLLILFISPDAGL